MRNLRLLLLVLAILISHWAFVNDVSFGKEIDDDQPMGAVGGTVHVDPFTGTATTSIPIQVAAGRNGIQPNLQLVYSSANGNGWVGMGWKLELGAIERSTRFGVVYNPTPADNGNVYGVRLNGVSSELIKLAPNTPNDPNYRAKVEGGFLRVRTLSTGGWEVTDRKGTKYFFGISSNARVEDPSDPSRVFRWSLERIEDTDRNYMLVTYVKDQSQTYPSQIDYTYSSNDASPQAVHSIKFHLGTPAGMTAPDTYNAYFKVATAKRLQAIEIQSNGAMMRAYKLSYSTSSSTGASTLTKVEQFGRNSSIDPITHDVTGVALPPVTMTYASSAPTFMASTTDWLTGWCSGGTQVNTTDLNRDGLHDLWCKNPAGGISGARATEMSSLTNTGTGVTGCTQIGVADFNGDGRGDAVCYALQQYTGSCLIFSPPQFCLSNRPQYPRIWISTSDQNGVFSNESTWLYWNNCYMPAVGQPVQNYVIGTMDFDGDGISDMFCATTYTLAQPAMSFARSDGNGSLTSVGSIPNFCNGSSSYGVGGGDFSGDGKSDIWCLEPSTGNFSVYYSTSTNTSASFTSPLTLSGFCQTPISYTGSVQSFGSPSKLYLSDFNGDGLQDIWCHRSGGDVKVALSTGTSFTAPSIWRSGWCGTGSVGVADFNGDGVSDLWCHTSDGNTQVALSTGATFTTPSSWSSGFCSTGTFGTGDLNGDGKPDLWCHNNGNVSVATAGDSTVKADLLASMSNGLGASTTLTYTPSTQLGVAHTLLPYPIQVVTKLTSSVSTSTGSGIANVVHETNYQYAKGYHSLTNRDFRGFKTVTITACANCTNTEKTVTVTDFHQGSGVSPTEDTGTTLTHPDAPTKGLPYRILVQDSGLAPLMETITTYAADADSLSPWFSPSIEVLTNIYSNGSVGKSTRVEFVYDHDYGNVVRENHYGEISQSGDEKTIERDFANESSTWLIGFPKRETIYNGISTAVQDKMVETLFYYDGTATCATASTLQVPTIGHLTRTVNWLNGGVNPEIRMAYDAYGNKVCQRDPNGNSNLLTYDSTNTMVKTVTNPLGHVTTTQYYGIDSLAMDKGLYGQVKTVTDPNSQAIIMEYDVFGRNSKTTAPDGLVTTVTYNYGTGFSVGTQHISKSASGAGLVNTLTSANYFDGLGRSIKQEANGPDSKTVVTEVQFDSRGAVLRKSLPYFKTVESVTGRWSTTTYDPLGRVIRVDNPDGTRSLSCFANWVTVTVNAADHRKRETKDAFGRTIRIDEYQGISSTCNTDIGTPYATTSYQYGGQGNLLSVTDAKGNISTMTYDTLGRKTAVHDPDMGNWSYVYDASGNLTKQTDAKGQVLWFQYDALNRRVQKDFTTQKTLGSGDVRYTYDGTTNNRKGRLQQVVDASGTVVFQYDSVGRILQTEKSLDGTTYTTQSTYDGLDRVLTVTYPGTPAKTISYAYNGPVLDKVFEGTTTYIRYTNYNALGQAGTTTYGNGVSTTKSYANTTNTVCSQQNFRLCTLKTNGPGSGGGGGATGALSGSFTATPSTVNLSTEGTTDWAHWGLVDASSFDHKSGVTTQLGNYVTLGSGTPQSYNDNGDGYTWTGGTPTASATNTTTGIYVVGLNNGFQIIVPADTTSRTLKLYLGGWASQAKLEATLSDSSAATYIETSFNDAGVNGTNRVYTLTYQAASASQTLTVKWTVTGMNNPQWGNVSAQAVTLVTNSGSGGGGGGSSTTYNAQADFSSTQGQQGWYYLSSTGAQLTWNGNFWAGTDGYIGLWNDGGYPGNSTDSVRRWVAPAAGSVQITGQAILAETCGGDGTTVTVKKNGMVLWTEALPVHTVVHSFSLSNTVVANDQLDFVTNRTGTSFCDNTIFTPTIVLTTGSGGSGTAYQDLRYVYTPDGNVSDIYDNLIAAGAGDQHLSYDNLSRLTLANGPYGTSGANASLTYTYDELGNLTFNTQVGTYTYPTSGSSSVRPHAVTAAGSNTYSYDANGNLTSGAGRTLTYNLENKPLTITMAGQTTTFVYDGEGGRVKKTAASIVTRYIGKLYECDNASCARMVLANGERIASIGASGTTYYYHTDHLGSSSVITDSAGAKAQALSYYPFGATRTNNSPVTPTIDVPYKYTGKELDSSTNLSYYEARYYDPILGRFLSADTAVPNHRDPQSLNRYAYVRNNPMLYTDPSGHVFGIDDVIIIGIIVGMTTSGIQSNWDPGKTLLGGMIGGVSAGVGFGTGTAVSTALNGGLMGGIAGGIVGGAVAGGTSGALAKSAGYNINIGLAVASGAAAGGIAGGAGAQWGQWGMLAAAPAAGASAAAIQGSDPGVGALVASAAAAFALGVQSAYNQYALAQNQDLGMNQERMPEYTLVSGGRSEVVRKSINISSDGILTFDVKTEGILPGSGLGVRLQTGLLIMDLAGVNHVNFRDWANIPGTVGSNGIAHYGVSVSNITGPAYMRIIPDYLGTLAPVITNFGPGLGGYIPCKACRSELNYDQPY